MCTLCAMTQTFDPARHDPVRQKGGLFRAEHTETADADSSTFTRYSMAAGDSFQGTISEAGDEDWVRLSLDLGKRYEVTLTGIDGGGGTLADPVLTLYNSSGEVISVNDDYTNRDSALTFTVDAGFLYYISAAGFDGAAGSYRLEVTEVSAPDLDEDGFLDAAAGPNTIYNLNVGETFSGEIGTNNDVDWVRIFLNAGETYTIGVSGVDGGGGTLADPFLEVYDADSNVLDSDDDGGIVFDSELGFTPSQSGFYYIAASGVASAIGTYTISVSEGAGGGTSPPFTGGDGTLDQLAAYLTDGYWEDDGRARRAFNTTLSNEITVDLDALTLEGKQLARWAMETWEMVANITFREVSFGADIFFDDEDSGAYASSRTSGTRILDSEVNVDRQWLLDFGTGIDSQSFATYVHEIGHAIGLGHQGDYNGNARYGGDETFANDSWQVSVMSYFSQTENTTTDASYANVITAMMSDIAAIQSLYGAAGAGTATAGDTVWGANTTLGGYMGAYFQEVTGGPDFDGYDEQPVAFTIFDAGGEDTFDLSTSSRNNRFDMRAENFSDIAGLTGNVGIARGTVLENLIGGSGNDTVTGNSAANDISGAGGNDSLDGRGGADNLDGGGGADNLSGGDGADTVLGGSGADEIYGNSGVDVIDAGDGDDYVSGGFSTDEIHGGNGRDELQGRTGADTIYGGTGDDTIYGSQGIDVLHGGGNDDEMYGATASDFLYGDGGNDTMFGSQGRDELRGGDGRDDLSGGSGSDTLYGDAGNDELRGNTGADIAYGGLDADSLFGGTGSDSLYGEDGNDLLAGQNGGDVLTGGAGNDTLRGGGGEDTFVFDTGFETDVIEDFSVTDDQLRLSRALTEGLSDGAAIVAAFADDSTGTVVFTFGGSDQITLEGLTSTDGLAAVIEVFG